MVEVWRPHHRLVVVERRTAAGQNGLVHDQLVVGTGAAIDIEPKVAHEVRAAGLKI